MEHAEGRIVAYRAAQLEKKKHERMNYEFQEANDAASLEPEPEFVIEREQFEGDDRELISPTDSDVPWYMVARSEWDAVEQAKHWEDKADEPTETKDEKGGFGLVRGWLKKMKDKIRS